MGAVGREVRAGTKAQAIAQSLTNAKGRQRPKGEAPGAATQPRLGGEGCPASQPTRNRERMRDESSDANRLKR